MTLSTALGAELLKQRKTLAAWLIIAGSVFTPLAVLIARITHPSTLRDTYTAPAFWQNNWMTQWESMAFMLLPLGLILASSLVTQLEFRNHTWKQWHTTPFSLLTLYTAKYTALLLMTAAFFILFNLSIWVSAVAIPLFNRNIPYPPGNVPWRFFLEQNVLYFIHLLPLLSLQFGLGLLFRNFLVSIGVGILLWIAAIGAIAWQYNYTLPHGHSSLFYLKTAGRIKLTTDLVAWSLAYFVIFTISGYLMYAFRREKT